MDELTWREQRRRQLTENSPLYRAGLLQLKDALRAENSGKSGPHFLKSAGHDAKEAMIDIIVEDLVAVAIAENRFLINRQKLSGYVHRMARYGVLTPPDMMQVGVEVRPGVSGELNDHLDALVELDKGLNRLAAIDNVAVAGDLTSVCRFGYWSARLGARIFNSLRRELNDTPHDPAQEWFADFVSASGALEEARYRRALGLDTDGVGTKSTDQRGWYVALAGGGWIDLDACVVFAEQVANGTAKPRTRWLHLPEPAEPLLEEITDEGSNANTDF